jgi:methyl halide transferase
MKQKIDKSYWDDRYQKNETGWDLNQVSPSLKSYFDQLKDTSISILIPGGGNSHEAEYLHYNGFANVCVVDISETPLKNLKKRTPQFPEENLVCADFFELDRTFDLIIEQTFFCALDPVLRKKYVTKMHSLLNENGKLVGLLFDAPLNTEHPPFGGNREEYKLLFKENFEFKTLENAYNSIAPRADKEVFINFIKK